MCGIRYVFGLADPTDDGDDDADLDEAAICTLNQARFAKTCARGARAPC